MKALFVESGLELRILTDQFIHDYFKTGIIITTINDLTLEAFANSKKIPLHYILPPVIPSNKWLYSIEQIQKIRLQKKLKSKSSVKLSKNYRPILHLPLYLLHLLFHIFIVLHKAVTRNSEWESLERLFISHPIDEIIFAGHTGVVKERIAAIAKKQGIRTYVIQNSWKDLFINPYLQIQVDKMNVWSAEIAGLYRYLNTRSKQINWIIDWHPRLKSLLLNNCQSNINQSNQTIILYTCANPSIIPNEMEILEKILSTTNSKIHFLVRPNPQDCHPERWKNLTHAFKNFSVDHPAWHWDIQSKVNFPTPESDAHWEKLLCECSIVMNIASTVTVEALLVQKSVINITFGADGKPSELIQSQTFLPYYEGLLQHPNVFVCNSLDALNSIVSKALSTKFLNIPVEQHLISQN